MKTCIALCDLRPGQKGIIERFLNEALGARLRLQEMGLLPGTWIELVRRAPWGGPIQIKVGSVFFALRKSEAALLAIRIA